MVVVEGLHVAQHAPGDPCQLVGQGGGELVALRARAHSTCPRLKTPSFIGPYLDTEIALQTVESKDDAGCPTGVFIPINRYDLPLPVREAVWCDLTEETMGEDHNLRIRLDTLAAFLPIVTAATFVFGT